MLEWLVSELKQSDLLTFAILLEKVEPATKIEFPHLDTKLREFQAGAAIINEELDHQLLEMSVIEKVRLGTGEATYAELEFDNLQTFTMEFGPFRRTLGKKLEYASTL